MKGCPTSKIIELLWGSCSTPWVYNITIWPDCDVQLTLVTQSVIAPSNVTGTINVYNSWTATNYTCGLWFDVDFTDVSWATYYQLFEWATQIWSNSATSNFVVTWQTAGSHTYTIKACNWAWCSTGTNFSVTLSTCNTIWASSQPWEIFRAYNFQVNTNDWYFSHVLGQWDWLVSTDKLWTSLNNSNNSYTPCGSWSNNNDPLNGAFVAPSTQTYNISWEVSIDWFWYNWWNWFNMYVALMPLNVSGNYSSVPWTFVTHNTSYNNTFYNFNLSQSLNAWTCYAFLVWCQKVWWNDTMQWVTVKNIIIS